MSKKNKNKVTAFFLLLTHLLVIIMCLNNIKLASFIILTRLISLLVGVLYYIFYTCWCTNNHYEHNFILINHSSRVNL